MSVEHISKVDVNPGGVESPEIESNYADLLIVDSKFVTQAEAEQWHAAGLEFLSNLSEESFQLRFGSPKPHEVEGLVPLVDYFAFSKKNHHQMILLTLEDELIGAASIFDYRLRERNGATEVIDVEHVVELSVTVSDDYQGQGLGPQLLQAAAEAAVDAGKTHVYTSFNPENDRSRQLVQSVLGSANIVAGKYNITDKFWRLPNVSSKEYSEIELSMKLFCGDAEQTEESAEESPTRIAEVAQDIGRTARRLTRISLHPLRQLHITNKTDTPEDTTE